MKFEAATPRARKAKVLLIGPAGSGKTHASLTFEDPIVIDAEGSSDWFADRFAFRRAMSKNPREIQQAVDEIIAGRLKCGTLVIDSLTSVYNTLIAAGTKDDGSVSMRNWGIIKRRFSGLLDNLYHKAPCHVVCIGWVKPEYAKTGDKVNGKIVEADELVKVGEMVDMDKKAEHAFDFVLRMEFDRESRKFAATVLKSRAKELRAGQRIENFSWATLAPFCSGTATGAVSGMETEEEAALANADLFADDRRGAHTEPAGATEPPETDQEPTPSLKSLQGLANAAGVGRLGPWLIASGIAPDLLERERTVLNRDEALRAKALLVACAASLSASQEVPLGEQERDRGGAAAPKEGGEPSRPPAEPMSDAQKRKMFALFGELNVSDARRRDIYRNVAGVEHTADLTREGAHAVIEHLLAEKEGQA